MAESGEADLTLTLASLAVARINSAPWAHVESLTIPRIRLLALN